VGALVIGASTGRPERPGSSAAGKNDGSDEAERSSRPRGLMDQIAASGGGRDESRGHDGERGAGKGRRGYEENQVMVPVAEGESARDVARALGLRLEEPPGRSGYARMSLPPGQTVAAARRSSRANPKKRDIYPIAELTGLSKGGKKASSPEPDSSTTDGSTTDGTASDSSASPWAGVETDPCAMQTGGRLSQANDLQWHLGAIAAFPPDRIDFQNVTIAVIDTGVAYENHSDATGTYVQAPSLAHTPIVAPWDFVNDDAHANDDHQHGTHIASIIASRGTVEGVAPGATIMPLKVLDSSNSGNELSLIEAIYHAIDNGADIINMSLSFPPDYPGSPPLRAALSAAAEAGVFVVAAAGNNGLRTATWPAAHPDVYAVAANGWSGADGWTVNNVPDYANRSARVDGLAPGGDLSEDADGNGVLDGVVAETISPDDPSSVGLWAIAGSSQAAAIASAVAAYPVAAGHSADMVPFVLGDASWSDSGSTEHTAGLGSGLLLADQAQWLSCGSNTTNVDPGRVHASILPVISALGGGQAAPLAHVKVTDGQGAPLSGHAVHATLAGTTSGSLSCVTASNGECQLVGPSTAAVGAGGTVLPLEWSVTVDVVVEQQSLEPYRPQPVLWTSDALELMQAAATDLAAGDDLLALSWSEGTDARLGPIAEGYSVVAGGTGLASSPLGVVFNLEAVADMATVTETTLDLDGSGLASSPLGLMPVSLLRFDGSGLASSPLGLVDFQLLAFSGTGLASSPLGFTWTDLTLGEGDSIDEPSLTLDGGLIDLQSGSIVGASAQGTLTGDRVASGGWTVDTVSLDAPRVLLGSGTLETAHEVVSGSSADDGQGAVGL
jgi:hypothetical protein